MNPVSHVQGQTTDSRRRLATKVARSRRGSRGSIMGSMARAEAQDTDPILEIRMSDLRKLCRQAQEAAAEEERQRLARDLHDAVTQMLFSASMIAEVLPHIWDRDPAKGRHHLEDLRLLTRGALAEVRALLLELRPDAYEGGRLSALLQQASEVLMGKLGSQVTLAIKDTRDESATPLPATVQVALYRVTQEALNNIARHAAASKITIDLDLRPEGVDIEIRDDGKGFDTECSAAGRFGLSIMRERIEEIGGSLAIESKPGCGTLVHAQWQG